MIYPTARNMNSADASVFMKLVNALETTPDNFGQLLSQMPREIINGTKDDYNIVHFACKNPNVEYLICLFNSTSLNPRLFDIAYRGHETRDSPLHVACQYNPDAVALLLSRVNPENTMFSQNFDGYVPLDIALMHNLKSVENFLNSPHVSSENLMKYEDEVFKRNIMIPECVEYLDKHEKYIESRRLLEEERNLRYQK